MIGLNYQSDFPHLIERMQKMPDIVTKASVMAVNEGARFGRAAALREMNSQVMLGKKYLGDNLLIKKAQGNVGEIRAVVTGIQRPVSLARYAASSARAAFLGSKKQPKNMRIRVRTSSTGRVMPKAFFVRLRSGREFSETHFNVGLAIRLKPGQQVQGRHISGKPMAKTGSSASVYLLYGPSVDQVFRTVREDVSPEIVQRVRNEFGRQFKRLAGETK